MAGHQARSGGTRYIFASPGLGTPPSAPPRPASPRTVAAQVRLQVTQAVTGVPEPGTYLLMVAGLALLANRIRRPPSR